MPILNKEPKYYAYRIDLKRREEFYDISEVRTFFKASNPVVYARSAENKSSHVIGVRLNERWLIFNAGLKKKYVDSILETWKSEDTKFPESVIKHAQEFL